MLILTLQDLEETIQKFVTDNDGNVVDLSQIYTKLDNIEATLNQHLTNHPTGEGGDTGVSIDIEANTYTTRIVPTKAIEPEMWIRNGKLHFYLTVTESYNLIPGGDKETENPPLLVKPEGITIPSADTVPLIVKSLTDFGRGHCWKEHADIMVPFVTRWSRTEEREGLTKGTWVIKLQLTQDGTEPHGKRYLSKWPRLEDEGVALLGGGDHIAGWIPLY